MKGKLIQIFKNFGWKQWLILFAFLAVVGFTAFHFYRTAQRAAYWREHKDEPIAEWMPVGYIAHSYHVPPPELYKALGLEPKLRDRTTLKEIAESQNRSFEETKAILEKAIADFRAAHPLPPDGGNR